MTTNAQHTAGPWFDWETLEWLHEPQRLLANTEDARLIAAAPELLEALEWFRSFGCPNCGGDCASANPPVNVCPMRVANSAILKATGEPK